MSFDFSDKKVLVTGAARGIGRGIALALAKAGCNVYALDCNKANLDKLASEHPEIETILQDLSNWEETRATLEKLEVMDGLVNNAAVFYGTKPALENTKDDLDKHISVNLFGYINCLQVVGKKMVSSGKKGSIVNISSIHSHHCWTGYLSYAVAKAGVDMVTKQFALELGPHNIRVNSVNPTLVMTEIADVVSDMDHFVELLLERTPLGRYAQLEDIVGPVLYLLSDAAAMVTGTVNMVDGGLACNITTKQ